MEPLEKALLNSIQDEFPIDKRPYLALAKKLNSTEDQVMAHIAKLKEDLIIRRIGGIFDSRRLGYTSALCAAIVSEENINQTAELINKYEEVTHNYLRSHRYNMWFTLTAANELRLQEIIQEIKGQTGIQKIMILRAVRTFKIKVTFKLEGE